MSRGKRERDRLRKQQNALKKTREDQKRVKARLRKQERSRTRKGELEKEKKKLRALRAKEDTIQNQIVRGFKSLNIQDNVKRGYKALADEAELMGKKKKKMDRFLDNIL